MTADGGAPEPDPTSPELETDPPRNLRALGMLAAGIAHDFNNILTAVEGHVQLAIGKIDTGDPDQALAFLEQAESGCRRASAAVQQLLSFTRPAGENAEIDLAEAVARAVDLLRGAAPAGVELRVTIPRAAVLIRGKRVQIDQIVVNLCTNSWQAMPEGRGVIEVRVEAGAERARLHVRDDGAGVPEELRERIFEPFFTTKPMGQGSGLGLAVVRGVVAQLGGEIALVPLEAGGVEFQIEIPRLPSTDA